MTAKEYLSELKRLDTCVNQKIQEKDELYKSGIKSVNLSECGTSGGVHKDVTSSLVERIIGLETEIDRQIDFFVDRKHEIINQIQSLKQEAYVAVLYKRYVAYKRLDKIAAEMNYTSAYIRRLHGRALREFGRLYEKNIGDYAKRIHKDTF